MNATTFLIQCLNALQYGLLLFLVASGLTLIFGIMGVINLAHGSFYMLGAYLALTLTQVTGDVFLATALGIPLAVAFGAAIEWAFVRHLYARDHLYQVLVTYGLILIFNELQRLIYGDDVYGVAMPALLSGSIPLTGTLSYPIYRIFLSGVCVAVIVAMYLVVQKTRLGMMIRAGSVNREMVQSLGINSPQYNGARRVFAILFTIAVVGPNISFPIAVQLGIVG